MTAPGSGKLAGEGETRTLIGPATRAVQEHELSLLRCLEPANRLVSSLQGEALNRLQKGVSPAAGWPWGPLSGAEVLRLLWARLADSGANR